MTRDKGPLRPDGRRANELRPIKIRRRYTRAAPGSVLISTGRTTVLCTASVDEQLPPWMKDENRGWITAEYSMLPGSTNPRKRREREKLDGRTTEIQRLIGRSLRAIADLDALGPRTITVDCDVLEADGGTRTASINGAFIALVDALDAFRTKLPNPTKSPLKTSVAAVSVGLVQGRAVLDLDYQEDVGAEVDMNIVMTGDGRFVEVQGTGEEATFSQEDLNALLALAARGIRGTSDEQKNALGKLWTF